MARTQITRKTLGRTVLALPLLLSACARTSYSNGMAPSFADAGIPAGCAVDETGGGVSSEGGRQGFAFSTPPAFQTMGDTQ